LANTTGKGSRDSQDFGEKQDLNTLVALLDDANLTYSQARLIRDLIQRDVTSIKKRVSKLKDMEKAMLAKV